MSPRPSRVSEHLQRLDDEGYELDVRDDGHLVISHIPYVDSTKAVRFGVLAYPGDELSPPIDHTIWWAGDAPCDRHGTPLNLGNYAEVHQVGDVQTNLRFSRKPEGGYANHYDKVATYVQFLQTPAQDLEPGVTAQTYGIVEPSPTESPFLYADTATPRARITEIAERLRIAKVAIVGLGGTGSYILDFISKSPVWEIHLFDGDVLASHNAFRAPGAVSKGRLLKRPQKIDELIETYSKMRRGLVPHGYLDEVSVEVLRDMDFVFLSLDQGKPKQLAVEKLVEFGVPFVDVGMGVYVVEGERALGGTLRTTLVTPEDHSSIHHINFTDAAGDDAYSTNIQIVELNAMHAAMAVIAWKRHVGFYKDTVYHSDSAYQICSNYLNGEGRES